MSFNIRNWAWDEAEYELTQDIIWDSEKPEVNYISEDKMLEISCGEWCIKKGFRWNGTTAVPDGMEVEKPEEVPVKSISGHPIPITWKASLIHDIGCREVYNKGFPYKRKEVDKIFFKLLKEIKFSYAKLYYVGVRMFSIFAAKIFWLFGKKI